MNDGTVYDFGSFHGQVGAQTNVQGFLELSAGVIEAQSGRASIDVTGAADFLYITPIPGLFFCLKPQVPSPAAAVMDCDGGSDLSKAFVLDHHIGVVGTGGFSSSACLAANGTVEGGHRLCAAGRVDESCREHRDCDTAFDANDGVCGVEEAACTAPTENAGNACRADGDCDSSETATDGVCGSPGSHDRVCNGPLTEPTATGDSGPGAVLFSTPGLRASLSVETALPCGDEGDGLTTFLPFTSAAAAVTIHDADNVATSTFSRSDQGTGFSCASWTDPSGPGCLVLLIPALDQFLGRDTITEMRLCGP